MKRFVIAALTLLACGPTGPAEHYGFLALLGRDTVSVESVTRRGSKVTSDAVDRFPRVRRRHTEIDLAPDGSIRRLAMEIHTPSEPADQRERRVVAEVRDDGVHITKRDREGTLERDLIKGAGEIAMAHVPQMYSLYELYFAAALRRAAEGKRLPTDTVQMRQFYIDREFDRYPLHRGVVRFVSGTTIEITHDWLAGTGVATIDTGYRLRSYSGARTTYQVAVSRLAELPDVRAIAEQFESREASAGFRQLSVRDTTRASIGGATVTIDYSRPLARGRALVGGVIPYDRVWRTGANAATQFTTSAPITLAGLPVPAGTYTLWTIPHTTGVELVVNKQTGQWGTEYGPANDLGRASLKTETLTTPVEQFTISVDATDARRGTLAMAWGPFRWTAPIELR